MSVCVSSADVADIVDVDVDFDFDVVDVDPDGIDLTDIEALLERVPDIARAVVVPHQQAGADRLLAYLTLTATAGVSVDEEALRGALETVLPPRLVPSSFIALAEFPRLPHGEIDRTRLTAVSKLRRAPDAVNGTPANESERRLLGLFEEVLRVWPLGTEESFFAVGGDARDATRLCARISQELGVRVSADVLLEAASVAELVRRLSQRCDDDGGWQVRVQSGDARPPVFFLPRAGGSSLDVRALAAGTDPRRRFLGLPWQGVGGGSEPSLDLAAVAHHLVCKLVESYDEAPIYLVGEGDGGLLAYEMAAELAARGSPPALLALLDTAGPGRSLARLQAALPRLWRQGATSYRPRRYDGQATLFRAHSLPFGVKARLDPLNGWRDLLGRRLEVVTLPGRPGHLLGEPCVASLVPAFGRVLARADAAARVWSSDPRSLCAAADISDEDLGVSSTTPRARASALDRRPARARQRRCLR